MKFIRLIPAFVLFLYSITIHAQVCNYNQLPANLQNGLVAWYPFCGNASDASGNGNNGSIISATITNDRFGNPANAYLIDGINCPSPKGISSPYVFNNTKSYSVSVWFQSTDPIKQHQTIFNSNLHTGVALDFNHSFRPAEVMPCIGVPGVSWTYCPSTSYPLTNQTDWHHAVLTKDSSKLTLYLDGIERSVQGIPVNINAGTFNLIFGAITINGGINCYEVFKGKIDDVLLFNRIITACEVSQLYNASNTLIPPLNTLNYSALQDTTRACGTSTILDAGSGYSTYSWNTGATTQTINVTTGGFYKVTVTNETGCSASDSTYLSLVDAQIANNDTTICKGSSLTISLTNNPILCVSNPRQLFPGPPRSAGASISVGTKGYYGTGWNNTTFYDDFWEYNSLTNIWTQKPNFPGGPVHDPVSFEYNGSPYIGLGSNANVTYQTGIWKFDIALNSWALVTNFPGTGRYNAASFIIGNKLYIAGGHRQGIGCLGDFWSYDFVANIWTQLANLPFGANRSGHAISFNNNGYLLLSGNDGCITNQNQLWRYNPANNSWIQLQSMPGAVSRGNARFAVEKNNKLIFGLGGGLTDFYSFNPVLNTWDSISCVYSGTYSPIYFNIGGTIYIGLGVNSSSAYVQEFKTLSLQNINQVSWSTGAITNSITVSPTQTTTYYVTVSDGITSCIDSVKVTVSDIGTFNPLQDTTRVCGTSTLLDAGSGYATYSWNTGATTQTINATTGGFYKVTVTNATGCSATDSTVLSLVNARIINNDTTICKGSSIRLAIDSLFPGRIVCSSTLMPSSLQSGLVAYWPFCGNADDRSTNTNNGIINGASLSYDRFNKPGNSYYFNGNSFITIPDNPTLRNANLTVSAWAYLSSNATQGTFVISKVKTPDVTSGLFNIQIWDQSRIEAVYHNQGNCSAGDANWQFLAANISPMANKWVNIVSSYASDSIKTYINGQLINKVKSNRNSLDLCTGSTINIGKWWDGDPRYFLGRIDDIGLWNRALTPTEISNLYSPAPTVIWSTGATTNSIIVNPTQTTTYYVTVSDGITTCIDSVKVSVSDIGPYNPLADTTRVCGTSTTLDAGSGYTTYNWNTGATTQNITATNGGFYKAIVTNALGCTASDSTFLSLVNARILNNDTIICKSSTITLSIDSLFPGRTVCTANQLPANLQNGLVGYWPFCGNANDGSLVNNHGTLNGAILATDRFNRPDNSAYFDGINDRIEIPHNNTYNSGTISISLWFNAASFTASGGFGPHLISKREASGWGGSFQNSIGIWNNQYSCWADWTIGVNGSIIYESPNPIQLGMNKWFHFLYTHDGNQVRIYLNGVNVKTIASPGLLTTNSLPLWIGARPIAGSNSQFFTGKIDDVQIWNRAVSAAEVLQLYTPAPSVIWSTGANTNSITVTPTLTSTTYYVTVTDGITSCTDSVKVNISTVDTSLTLLDPTQVCAVGGQVRMRAGITNTYQWQSSTNGVNFTNIIGANLRDFTATSTGYYRAIVTNALNCVDSTRVIQVTLYAQPQPAFTVNSTTQCANGNNFVFTNTSVIGNGTMTYTWYFGDGGTASTTNASHVYSTSGTFIVKLIAGSNNGCIDSISRTVTVNPSPITGFTINSTAQCLNSNSFSFTNTSSISSGTLLYQWYFGDGGTATTANAVHSYTNAGSFSVKLVVRSSAVCADSTTQQVTVYPMPSGSLSAPASTIICNGSTVTLTASGGNTYQWYLGNLPIPGATSASYDASQAGVYTVELVSSTDCRAMATGSVTLSLVSRPTAAFSFDKYCAGFATQFTNTSAVNNSGIVGYAWNFGDAGTSTLVNPSHVYTQSGTYTVTLTATPLACPNLSDIKSTVINIAAPPANQRYTTLNAVANRNIQLNARSFTIANYFWTPSVGLNNNFIQSPVFNYDRQQQYLVRINTMEGCVVTDTILIRIFKEREIYVPDVFSPNGDGKNDKLTPLLVGITSLKYFKVFDRWGQLMFATSMAGAGWDGYYKGAKQPFETYAWIAEGVDVDGNTIKRSGSSILIR